MHDKHTSSSESCVISAAHYGRTLLAIPSRLCLTWLRLSLKISNASSVLRGGGSDACVDGNRRDSGGMLHACLRMKSHAWTEMWCLVFKVGCNRNNLSKASNVVQEKYILYDVTGFTQKWHSIPVATNCI